MADPLHLEDYDPDYQRRFSRKRIKESWDNQCAYCGAEATTLDHVVPKSKGGPNDERNLVPACLSCNQSKGDRPMQDWYQKQPFYCGGRLARILRVIGHG